MSNRFKNGDRVAAYNKHGRRVGIVVGVTSDDNLLVEFGPGHFPGHFDRDYYNYRQCRKLRLPDKCRRCFSPRHCICKL